MSKSLKSPWDFGELFPPEATRRVLTVSELTASVKKLLEREIGQIWVTGEITNLRLQSSGHAYFSLKDASAQLSCVLFRGEASGFDRGSLQDGAKVVLQGAVSVYEARGQYQLRVLTVELQGVGALQIAFEKLKRKLQAEGLFATERKRPLPRYPRRIGVVTSRTGAALRDVLHVIARRYPALEVLLASCRVQGQGAAEEISEAIRSLNEWSEGAIQDPRRRLDLILVTRGGGSLEDLWAFNEEIVARAIFESKLPVVSAVGHEIDFTISDFVADQRAATPSAAAEIITEALFASRGFVAEAMERLGALVRSRLESEGETLAELGRRLARAHPRRRLEQQAQRVDDFQSALLRCVKHGFRVQAAAWQAALLRLSRVKPSQALVRQRERLVRLAHRLMAQTRLRLRDLQSRSQSAEARLRLLSPQSVLERGYSITLDDASGNVIHAADEARAGQRLRTRLKSGEIQSVVEKAS